MSWAAFPEWSVAEARLPHRLGWGTAERVAEGSG